MSHGRDHDARGVKGTFRKGAVPDAVVLNAIPEALGAVGNMPEQVRPGVPAQQPRDAKTTVTPYRALKHDEGVPVLPGGNRDTTLATSRPSAEVLTPDKVEESEQVPAALPEPPLVGDDSTALQEAPELIDAEPEEEEKQITPLPTSKRKLIRSKVEDLRDWCAALDIVPEEYVDDGVEVTGDLMRVLVGEKLGIKHGIVVED